ncbi:hypothetical protein FB45DRAFT_910687, partial [Roridomyces roridus]
VPMHSPLGRSRSSPSGLYAQTSLIVAAGQETTAGTLAFGLLALARHPDVQESLRRARNLFNPWRRDLGFGYHL